MFERLVTKECCNYNNGKCLGAMFKFSGDKEDKYRELVNWIDKEKEDKQCLVTQGKYCDFFMNYVLPALRGKHNLQDLIMKYEKGLGK